MQKYVLVLYVIVLSIITYGYPKDTENLKSLIQDVINDEILKLDIENTLRSLDNLDDDDNDDDDDRDVINQYLQTFEDAEKLKTKRLFNDDNNAANKGTKVPSTSTPTPTTTPTTTTTTTTTTTEAVAVASVTQKPTWSFPTFRCRSWWCRRRVYRANRGITMDEIRTLLQQLDEDLTE